jgi:hypothetical protein
VQLGQVSMLFRLVTFKIVTLLNCMFIETYSPLHLIHRQVFFEKVPIKKPDPATEWIFERLADCIIKAKRSEDHKMAGLFFQYLVNGLVYELYFGSAFKKAGIQLLTLLNDDNLPELPEGKAGLKKLVQVFEHLHDKQHSIRIGLFKLDTVREVRIIEGKEK